MTATRLHHGSHVPHAERPADRVIEGGCTLLQESAKATDQKVWGSNPYGRATHGGSDLRKTCASAPATPPRLMCPDGGGSSEAGLTAPTG